MDRKNSSHTDDVGWYRETDQWQHRIHNYAVLVYPYQNSAKILTIKLITISTYCATIKRNIMIKNSYYKGLNSFSTNMLTQVIAENVSVTMCTTIMRYYRRSFDAVFKQAHKNRLHNNMHVYKYGAGARVGLIKRRDGVTFEIGATRCERTWTRIELVKHKRNGGGRGLTRTRVSRVAAFVTKVLRTGRSGVLRSVGREKQIRNKYTRKWNNSRKMTYDSVTLERHARRAGEKTYLKEKKLLHCGHNRV